MESAFASLPDLVAKHARARARALGLTQQKMVEKGLTAGTAHRATTDAGPNEPGQDMKLSTLEALAKALSVPAWALLHPDFDPTNPPAFRTEDEIETEIQRRMKERLEPFRDIVGGILGIEEEPGPTGRSRNKPFAVGPVKTIESHGELESNAPGTAGRETAGKARKTATKTGHSQVTKRR